MDLAYIPRLDVQVRLFRHACVYSEVHRRKLLPVFERMVSIRVLIERLNAELPRIYSSGAFECGLHFVRNTGGQWTIIRGLRTGDLRRILAFSMFV